MTTLILMIVAAVAGVVAGRGHRRAAGRSARFRSGWASRCSWPRGLFTWRNLRRRRAPTDAGTLDLQGTKLALGLAGNFALGALMTLGIGHVCAVHDSRRPARHERDGRVPDHDGVVRVPDAHRAARVRAEAGLLAASRRWHWRSAAFRPCSSPRSS